MEHIFPWAAIPSQRRGNLPADGGMELNHRLLGWYGIQMLVGRRLIQLEISDLSSPEKLDEEAEMQPKQAKSAKLDDQKVKFAPPSKLGIAFWPSCIRSAGT